MAGVLIAVDIALDGGVHGDDTQTADEIDRFRRISEIREGRKIVKTEKTNLS
jgi:hypothetical protein